MSNEERSRERILLPSGAPAAARRGGGVVLLVGLALMGGAWWLLPWDPGAPGVFLVVLRVLLTAVGGAFCALGLAVGWSRLGAEVDREAGRLVLLRRVAFYTAKRVLPLDDLHGVRLVAAGLPGRDTPAYFEFRLRGRGSVTFGFPATAAPLRTLLGWLRSHLDLPDEAFEDTAAGARLPSPDEEAAAVLARLSASRVIRAWWSADDMTLEFPPMGWRGIALGLAAVAAVSAAFVGFLGWQFLQRPHPPPAWVPFLFGLIPLAFLLGAVHLARKSLRIDVSGGLLRVEQRGLFRHRPRTFLRDQVVDLVVYTPPHGPGERPQTILTLLAKGRYPLLHLTHPALDRHPEEWEAVAEALRHYLTRR